MKNREIRSVELIGPNVIAPCGMNCAICIGFLRERNPCADCNGDDAHKSRHCVICHIKNCPELEASAQKFCFTCEKFPCARLRKLDKRYRANYGMSMIENLESIRAVGLEEFTAREKDRWKCPQCGGLVCVHREECIYCGQARS